MVTLLQSHVQPVVVTVKVVVLGYWLLLELRCYHSALKVVLGDGFMPCVVCTLCRSLHDRVGLWGYVCSRCMLPWQKILFVLPLMRRS
jgi:hypothetical protein